MFIGHIAVALSAKRLVPQVCLGTWVAAALFVDLLWPFFLLLGWERVEIDPGNTPFTPLAFVDYPWTHSLAMALAWSGAFAAVHFAARRNTRAAAWLALAVFSHWILDWVSHRPDLALYPGSDVKLGLGLWYSVPGTIAVETALFAAAVALYARATGASGRGRIALPVFVTFLLAMYASNILGPPPPSARALAFFALFAWLLVVWAWWVDKRRAPRNSTA
jgi:membrane-bound metal-dependent hydrolase YbcI (DUF457 family)